MNQNKEKIKKISIIVIIMALIIGYFIYQRKNEFTINEEVSNENTIEEPKEEKSQVQKTKSQKRREEMSL